MTDLSEEYEAGDINRVDDGDDADDADDFDRDDEAGEGNRSEGSLVEGVLTHLATSIADEPESVVVETEVRGRRATLRLHVAQPDMGRVIGRRGRTAQAIRALVAAAGAREGLSTSVDIVD